jgi:hypothetical protein
MSSPDIEFDNSGISVQCQATYGVAHSAIFLLEAARQRVPAGPLPLWSYTRLCYTMRREDDPGNSAAAGLARHAETCRRGGEGTAVPVVVDGR